MPKHIELPDDLYKRIQADAVPFVDLTEVSVIKRWADYYEAGHKRTVAEHPALATAPTATKKRLDPFAPPDLQHTRVSGQFGSIPFKKWNDLVRIAHIQAFTKADSFDGLKAVTYAQIEKGNRAGDRGFHFVPEAGLSVQGVDANHAWTYSLRLAQYCNVLLRAQIEWRHNDKAAHPGKTDVLVWAPVNSVTRIIEP